MEEYLADLQTQIGQMIAHGATPRAVVMTPFQLKFYLSKMDANSTQLISHEGSGWTVFGLPIYRSWRISGPAVLDDIMLKGLLRATVFKSAEMHTYIGEVEKIVPVERDHDPILF